MVAATLASCLVFGATLLQSPKVVSVRSTSALFERMGLQAAPIAGGIVLMGGFSYAERECLRQVSAINEAGGELLLKVKLAVGRNHFRAEPLDGTHVLVIGGYSESYGSLAEIEAVDLKSGRVEAWPWLVHESELFSTVRFGRKIAVIGGLVTQGKTKTEDAIQLIDLRTKEVSLNPNKLAISRFGHEAVWLPKQRRVLIVGGKHVIGATDAQNRPTYQELRSMEFWDPVSGKVDPAGELIVPRDRPKLWVQADGQVLIIGGASPDGKLASIELFDPATKVCEVIAQMAVGRMATSTLSYSSRGLIIAGGWVDDPEKGRLIEYFDFATRRVNTIGMAASSRAEHVMMWLNSREFVLAGGKDCFGARNPHSYAFKTTEIFRVDD